MQKFLPRTVGLLRLPIVASHLLVIREFNKFGEPEEGNKVIKSKSTVGENLLRAFVICVSGLG